MGIDPVQNLIEEIKDMKHRIKTLETAPSQQNMTVDRGATRILSDEGLQIGEPGSSSGSEIVYGTLTIVGKIDGDGQFEWSGAWRFDSGDGEIAGNVALTGTLAVDGGSIEVGDVVLSEVDGGSLAAPVRIVINTPLTELLGGLGVAQGAVFEGGITATGLPTITELASGLTRHSIYVHPTTRQLYRVVA